MKLTYISANLSNANLNDANFTGANLHRASLILALALKQVVCRLNQKLRNHLPFAEPHAPVKLLVLPNYLRQ